MTRFFKSDRLDLKLDATPLANSRGIVNKQINAVVWGIVTVYSFLYYSLGAYFALAVVLTGTVLIHPCIQFLIARKKHTLASMCLIFASNLYIFSSSISFAHLIKVEYYFLPATMLPVILLDPKRTKLLAVGFSLAFAGWFLTQFVGTTHFPNNWLVLDAPIKILSYINVFGSFAVTVVFLGIFRTGVLSMSQRILAERIKAQEIITEHNRLLTLSNDRFEKALEGAGLGSWDWWLDSNKVIFDKRWCDMLGLDSKTVDHNFLTWKSLVHPDDIERATKDVADYVSGLTPIYENIHRMKHVNGNWVWILDRGRISERDETGRATRFTGTHFDITSRMESEHLHEKMEKISKIGPWQFDFETSSFHGSRQTYEVFALGHEYPIQNVFGPAFYSPQEFKKLKILLERARQGTAFSDQFEITDAKGEKKIIEINSEPVKNVDGFIHRLIGTIQDVTLAHKTRFLLEEAQRVAKVGSWTYNLITKQIDWTKQMFDLFPEDSAKGPPTFERHRSTIHPDDLAHWEATVGKCASEGTPYQMRFRSMFPDGIVKWIFAVGEAKRNRDGTIWAIGGTCQDVTELVQMEERVKAERNHAAQSAKLASLGEMAAGIAHEINNPLAIVTMHANLLINEPLPNKSSDRVLKIIKSTERIGKIVNGLRKFSRSSARSKKANHRLAEVVNEAVALTQFRAKRIDAKVDLEIDPEVEVICNEIEIEQVVVNLLNNALDAISDHEDRWTKVRVYKEGKEAYLVVQDSGPPMPESVRSKLFEPFFTTKVVGEGTGLGLSIVKGILDEHGAKIFVDPTEPNTTFKVRFPIAAG